ncbi:hypothetical protein [Glutamicibacter ardleyensis]|uniref:hypothetical protein n=1 Tax=Glutamicibacter ardleyensis TaxID=225894 RepID=UPI003FD55831
MQDMFNLTPMTGRESKGERHTTFLSVDMTRRTQMIILASGLPGFAFMALFFPLLDAWAVLFVPIFIGTAFYLFKFKSPEGLEQRKYKEFLNKARSKDGKFLRGLEMVTIGDYKLEWLVRTVGEIPFDMLSEPIQKQVDYDRWEIEEQHRFQDSTWRENRLKDNIRATRRAQAEQQQADTERRASRKAKASTVTAGLKSKLSRANSKGTKEPDEG